MAAGKENFALNIHHLIRGFLYAPQATPARTQRRFCLHALIELKAVKLTHILCAQKGGQVASAPLTVLSARSRLRVKRFTRR